MEIVLLLIIMIQTAYIVYNKITQNKPVVESELTEEEKEIEKELLKSKQKKVETISHTYFEPFERYKK